MRLLLQVNATEDEMVDCFSVLGGICLGSSPPLRWETHLDGVDDVLASLSFEAENGRFGEHGFGAELWARCKPFVQPITHGAAALVSKRRTCVEPRVRVCHVCVCTTCGTPSLCLGHAHLVNSQLRTYNDYPIVLLFSFSVLL